MSITSDPRAVLVLGMHRSGTSCVAGMLAVGGVAAAGDAIRNWDNARGHHENLDAVRLNEAVLAHSGGHWLLPPLEVRWTDAHAAARDQLLAAEIEGRPALLKDPRTLLVLPFWRASRVPFHVIGIVRHPLSVARSLETWRGMPLVEGVALWTAHDRVLADDRARHGYTLVDFEAPKATVVTAVLAWCSEIGAGRLDEAAIAAAYEEQLVHHDDGDVPEVAGLDEAVALYTLLVGAGSSSTRAAFPRAQLAASGPQLGEGGGVDAPAASPRAQLAGSAPHIGDGRGVDTPAASPRAQFAASEQQLGERASVVARAAFPRAQLAAFERQLAEGEVAGALASARAALAAVADAAAVLVPVVTSLVRKRAYAEAVVLIAEHAPRLDAGLADLLDGKVLLAMGDAAAAAERLAAACAMPQPFFQARHLLPQALRAAGRHAEARAHLAAVAGEALYPHGPLATMAEWAWLDGEPDAALQQMQQAIEAAPLHRRGRLRTRRAEWLLARGDPAAARDELLRAIDEDPGYPRSRDVLRRIS